MLQVTDEDHEEELRTLNLAQPLMPEWKDLEFRQHTGNLTALFDFYAFGKNGEIGFGVDVKVRDGNSTAYQDYFVSKEKVYFMRAHPERAYYVIYFFKGNSTIRVYCLNDCSLIEEKDITFVHKRTGLPTVGKVFAVPAYAFCLELIVVD